MESKNKIINLFSQKDYSLICAFLPSTVVEALGFKDSLRLAYKLLYNPDWEEEPQLYAIDLILAVKSKFSVQWEKDWRNEAFLGSAYDVVLGDDRNYDERYLAYLNAFKKANPPPPELLIELARCYDAPGDPPVSSDQAINWLERSFEMEPYFEAAGLLSYIYSTLSEKEKSKYWGKIKEELEVKGRSSPSLEPPYVRE